MTFLSGARQRSIGLLPLKTKTPNSLIVTTLPCSLSRPKRKAELILLPVVSKTEKSFLTCFSTKRCLCLQREKGKTHKTMYYLFIYLFILKALQKQKQNKKQKSICCGNMVLGGLICSFSLNFIFIQISIKYVQLQLQFPMLLNQNGSSND